MNATDADPQALDLLQRLVEIPSLSGEEAQASAWLAERMVACGFDRAEVDAAGNAVGELGPADAERLIVLLGHIDTVPGEIPVRLVETSEGPVLYGRGAVDAKGPLAAFVVAAAQLGSRWAHRHRLRLVVAGAVEEESATSRGARHLRDRFDGHREPRPSACVIGEPSGWRRVTLGYKGRLLIRLVAHRPMAHTAGPDPGVATVAVDFWETARRWAEAYNRTRDTVFEQLQPSLRRLRTELDTEGMAERVEAEVGLRLPQAFDATALRRDLERWAAARSAAAPPTALELHERGYEPAWRSPGRDALTRAFVGAIRAVAPEGTRPGLVVKTGTSDMNVVAPAWGCPILAYGPGDSHLDHTPQEHLPLSCYRRAIDVLERALRRYVDSGEASS